MALQVKVLFDFDGEVDNGELVIRENQILTVIRQDVGDGWWEAETSNKQRGLIPQAYVEEYNYTWDANVNEPPPPPPPPAENWTGEPQSLDLPGPPTVLTQPEDSRNRPDAPPPSPPPAAVTKTEFSSSVDPWDKLEEQREAIVASRHEGGGHDDEWDEDDDWDDNQSTPLEERRQTPPANVLSKSRQFSTVPRKCSASQLQSDAPEADHTYCNTKQVAGIGKSRSFHHGKLSTFQGRLGGGGGSGIGGSLRITLPNRPLEMPPTPPPAAGPPDHQGGTAVECNWAEERGREMVRGDSTSTYDSSEDSESLHSDPAVNGSGNFGLSPSNRQYIKRNNDASTKATGTVKKNFASRFSIFAKSGGEAYLLGTAAKKGISANVEIRIVESSDGPIWEDPGNYVKVEIKNPKKETKMKGIKSYIAYQITPSDTGIQVSRRYKHFDWLYERLAEKFTFVCIPPLPDKQVTGRYEEAFIEKRMDQLQKWMNRMGVHPVIGQADVFRHFLSCTDEKRWKQGKRKAEKDENVGAAFLQVIQPPDKPLEIAVVERHHDNFSKFQKSMDQSVAVTVQTCHEFSKKHLGPFKREFQKVGHSFTLLSQSFELDTRPRITDDDRPPPVSVKLTDAMKHTGETYDSIGQLFSDQPRYDGHILEDFLREYSGLLSTFPDMISFHKHTISTVKECQKQREDQKLDYEEAETVKKRADVVSYAIMAEINHFHMARVHDFKQVMQSYLLEQIKFYKSITSKLEEAVQKYEDI